MHIKVAGDPKLPPSVCILSRKVFCLQADESLQPETLPGWEMTFADVQMEDKHRINRT